MKPMDMISPLALAATALTLDAAFSVNVSQRALRRRRLQSTDECSEDPFLWRILKSSGETAGFGVGTMHVPRELVTSQAGWQSLVDAADDSCTVYGELDITDPEIIAQVVSTCVPVDSVFVADIPDPEIKMAYETVLSEIAIAYYPPEDAPTVADQFVQTMPLEQVLQFIIAWNTPDLRDSTFLPLLGKTNLKLLDTSLLDLGHHSASLETIEETCTAQAAIAFVRESFLEDFDTVYASQLKESLNSSGLSMIDAYICGNEDGVQKVLKAETDNINDAAVLEALLDVRNMAMAARMVEVMDLADSLPLFAVGLAHWIWGEKNLQILLRKEGYILERVEGGYDPNLLPGAACTVVS